MTELATVSQSQRHSDPLLCLRSLCCFGDSLGFTEEIDSTSVGSCGVSFLSSQVNPPSMRDIAGPASSPEGLPALRSIPSHHSSQQSAQAPAPLASFPPGGLFLYHPLAMNA